MPRLQTLRLNPTCEFPTLQAWMAIFDFHLSGIASFVIQKRGVRFSPAIHECVSEAIGNHWRQVSFKCQMPGTYTCILEIYIPVRIVLGGSQKR